MGKEKKSNKRNLDEWKEIGHGLYTDNQGKEGELSTIVVDPLYATSNEHAIYDYRRDTKAPLVRAYDSAVLEPKKESKDSKQKKEKDPNVYMNVITEHIPHRLSQAPQLTYPESLYVLDRSLEGYENAYNRCGPSLVNDNMIGFNRQGEAKVWVNENFANNHPSNRLAHLESTTSRDLLDPKNKNVFFTNSDEAAMVENIANVVGDHSEDGRWREPFRSEVRGLGFREARNLIHDTAAREHVFIPDRVDLFTNKIRGYRTTTTTVTPGWVPPPVLSTPPPPVLSSPPPPVVSQPIHQTTSVNLGSGYKFNYLPVDKPFEPDVFASRVGEHGVHHGHRY